MQEELRKRWILKQPDQVFVSRCCDELKLSALLARMIALRDLTAIDTARCYLSSSLRSDLPSPFLMADMDVAVDRIVRAIQASESIGIWGDYDVDGTTGASVLVSFLREIGVEAIFYVPHRIEEGYGLNIEGLRRLKERGVRPAVTVDREFQISKKLLPRVKSASISLSSTIINRPNNSLRRSRWSIHTAAIARFLIKDFAPQV